jgi:predicted DNA-binding transcriptional regulator AlpA
MDSAEVAAAFGVTPSSLSVAMSNPGIYPSLANRLPDPLRRIGRAWVWRRADIEAAILASGPIPPAERSDGEVAAHTLTSRRDGAS